MWLAGASRPHGSWSGGLQGDGDPAEQFGSDTGGGSSRLSGFLSGLGSIFGLASGAFGGGTATLSSAPHLGLGGTFDDGGATGGRRGKVAGVVHGEEFVVRAGPAQRYRAILEAINEGQRLPGFQHGGAVPPLSFPDAVPRTVHNNASSVTNVYLGGLTVNGVKDADSFRRSEPQMMRDLQRKLAAVANRGTA